MKKALLLPVVLVFALAFIDANAQLPSYPGVEKTFYKPVNGNPLDAVRQRYLHSSQRRGGGMDILIDYAGANGDDFQLASNMNVRFAIPTDSTGDKYVVVACDSLHDSASDIGYNYSDFDSIAIDSLFIPFGHEKNTIGNDTLTVKIIQLNASGYPTGTVLWSQNLTASGSSSLSGQTDWLAFVELPLAPGITIPSTTKFGIQVEYHGAKQDTFGYLFSFVDLGACANLGISYSADYSAFWPNSYRFNVFNNLLLPTAPPNYGDVYWDCDGDMVGETANPVQNINYVVMARGIQASGGPAKIRLVRVNPTTEQVTIKNFGGISMDISTYTLCSKFLYTSNLSSQTVMAGSLNLGPGDTVKLQLTTLALDENGADLGLYSNSTFTDPNAMVDFTQWKTAGNGRESVAVTKGIWGAGAFVSGDSPYRYIGNGFQDGVTYWQGFQMPQAGCDTLSNVSTIGTAGFGVYTDINSGGGGYISGHNGFGDISKADFFANSSSNMEVTGSFYLFGVAEYGNANSSITAAVWDNSGAGGSPGNIIASETLLISDIAQDITNALPTAVQFNPPAFVSSDFYVGITFGYGPGDTVALFTDTIGSNTPTGWEQWDPLTDPLGVGEWYPYSSPNSWFGGVDIAHAIFPFLCTSTQQCPPITVSTTPTNSICTSSNGSATVTASGGNGPYTYEWSNGQNGATATGLAPGTYTVTATDADTCAGVGSVLITATTTNLSVTVTPTANTSCGTPNGGASAAVTNGTAPYSYAWSSGGITQAVSGLAANTYSVSVYDANGCSGTGSGTVTNNLPIITVNTTSNPNSQCLNPNGNATATASGGIMPYTYLWDAAAGNQTGATASNLSGGTYSVTATSGTGCTGTGSVTVGSSTPNIVINVDASSPNTTCGTPNGSATVSATGGTAQYTFAWDNGQTGPSLSNVGGGDYDVTATDANGCTGTTTVTITSQTPAINVTVNANANTHCVTPNGTATATATGGSGTFLTYQWNSGQSGMSISGLSAGNFTVVVTDDNGCTGTGTGTVTNNLPSFTVSTSSTPVTSCTSANGAASATISLPLTVSYVWNTVPQQTGPNATNLSAGTYQVTATDAASGCTASTSVNIGTNTPTVTVNISSSNNVTNCTAPNGSATAVASGGAGGFNYAWSNSQTGSTASNLAPGSYTVIATDQNGCTGTASVTISDNTATVSVAVNVSSDVTSCSNPNGSVLAVPSPSGQYTYAWSNGGSSASLNNLTAGTYTVTVTSNNQCTAVGSATVGTNVSLPTVTASATNETSANANDGTATATANGGAPNYTYAWSNGGTTSTITGLDAGTYTVTVTDQAGCTASGSATVQTDVGIGNLDKINSLSLFPNPTKDVVNLKLELNDVDEIAVSWHNVLGEKVMESATVNAKSFEEKFDFSSLPQGIYMIRISVGEEEITRRITVIR